MTYERLRPVLWRGELVALAGHQRFHIVAPRLCVETPPEEDLRYVALLCLYHQQVLTGALPHSADPQQAERWVDTMLRLDKQT